MDTWEPTWPGRPSGPASLGKRIASLRNDRGWTQQTLADRLGISRVAVSHLESGTNTPGERTVALLAGLFRMEPLDLVAGTSYPPAKSDRLPVVVNRWTEAEHRLAMLERDLAWLAGDPTGSGGETRPKPVVPAETADLVLAEWEAVLAKLDAEVAEATEAATVARARRRVRDLRALYLDRSMGRAPETIDRPVTVDKRLDGLR